MIVFFRLDEEPALVQERQCRGETIPWCSQGDLLEASSETMRLHDAWWFVEKDNVESR